MESDQETPAASATSSTTTMINTFMAITSSTQEQAQFFLESHNFDVDAAISTFFESNSTSPPIAVAGSGSGTDFLSPQLSQSPSPSPSASPSRSRSHSPPSGTRSQYNLRSRRSTNNNNNDDVDDDMSIRRSNSRSRRARVGGVRTLANLDRNGSGSDSDSDHDRPRRPQRGKVVQDPSKDNDVEAIFEQARRMGAVKGPLDVHQPSSSSRSFTGKARLLSGEVVSSSPQERDPEVIMHIITFWRNGFTVDDGPLRSFDDEDNAPFLESIKKSECPKELEPADRKNSVRVNLVKRDENCPEPQKRRIPFEGVGRTLGTNSPVSSRPSAPATALNSAPSPVMGLIVDDKLPSTSIQLRLADGTRMVPRFNYHHTIRDIHAFIDASTPARTGAYTLQMMGFPPKQLTDLDQTIEQAGLANSVVILKFS